MIEEGHEVTQATNGVEGLQAILEQHPNVVISDCLMPHMSGPDMLKTIRRDHKDLDSLPFLFLSAYADVEHVGDVMQLGADAYVTKPVDLDEFLQAINALLVTANRDPAGSSDSTAAVS